MENIKVIRIPKHDPQVNKSGVIRVSPEAVDALLMVSQHTNMSVKAIASTIIVQAVNGGLVQYDEDDND